MKKANKNFILPVSLLFILILSGCTSTVKNNPSTNSNISTKPTTPIICTDFKYSRWSTCNEDGEQYRTITKMIPSGCIDGNPVQIQKCESINNQGQLIEPLDTSSLHEGTIKKIINKIKTEPNKKCGNLPCLLYTYDSGVAFATIIYEFSDDPLEFESKESLILTVSTDTYIDSDGKILPKGKEIQDIFIFRDSDFDGLPNDYWDDSFGENLDFLPVSIEIPDLSNLLKIWTMGINYFNQVK